MHTKINVMPKLIKFVNLLSGTPNKCMKTSSAVIYSKMPYVYIIVLVIETAGSIWKIQG